MKPLYLLIIFLYLFYYTNSTCEPYEENNRIRDPDDCNKRTLSDDEKEQQAIKCCFLKMYLNNNIRKGKSYECIVITQNDYNNIKGYVKQIKADNGADKVVLDCQSSYLKNILLSLILLIF